MATVVRVNRQASPNEKAVDQGAVVDSQMTGDLAHFVCFAFAVSWFAWMVAGLMASVCPFVLIAGTFGPAAATLILVLNRPAERLGLLVRFVRWRCPFRTLAFALALPIPGIATALVISSLVTGSGAILPPAMPAHMPAVVLACILFLIVAGEEPGWRCPPAWLAPGKTSPATRGLWTAHWFLSLRVAPTRSYPPCTPTVTLPSRVLAGLSRAREGRFSQSPASGA